MRKFFELVLKNLGRNRDPHGPDRAGRADPGHDLFGRQQRHRLSRRTWSTTPPTTRLVIRENWITPSRVPDALRPADRRHSGRRGLDALAQLRRLSRRNRTGSTGAAGAWPRGWTTCARCSPAWKKLDPALLDEMKRERTGRWSAAA